MKSTNSLLRESYCAVVQSKDFSGAFSPIAFEQIKFIGGEQVSMCAHRTQTADGHGCNVFATVSLNR